MKEAKNIALAPKAIGPYSHAVIANGFLFASGQIGVKPDTGEYVSADVAAQTRQCLKNLETVLAGCGCGLADVVKVEVFLRDMSDFAQMNQVYREFFSSDYPARVCVAISDMAAGAKVEISLVAALPKN